MWHSQPGDWTSIRPTISLNRDLTDWRYLLISFSTDHSYYLTLSRQLSDRRFIWEFIKFFLQDYCLPSNKEQIFEFPANWRSQTKCGIVLKQTCKCEWSVIGKMLCTLDARTFQHANDTRYTSPSYLEVWRYRKCFCLRVTYTKINRN